MPEVIDAERQSDKKTVAIKRIRRNKKPPEADIALYLTTPEMLQDPTNHCVPIWDRFSDDAEPQYEFIVMPLLRRFDDPPFVVVSEVVEFMKQTLEVSGTRSLQFC